MSHIFKGSFNQQSPKDGLCLSISLKGKAMKVTFFTKLTAFVSGI